MPTKKSPTPKKTANSKSSRSASSRFKPAPKSRFDALRKPALLIIITLAATVGVYFTFFASAASGNPTIVSIAASQVGQTNGCKYETGGSTCPYPGLWCAYFASWVYKQAGYPAVNFSSVYGLRTYFQGHAVWHNRGDGDVPQPGDVITFSSDSHAGIVDHVDGTTLYTIEGNYSHKVSRVSYANYSTYGAIVGWGRLSAGSPPVGGNPGASSAQFYLRNSNTAGNGNEAFAYGIKGDMPLEANWNGSSTGADTVGVFRPSNNTFYLRYSNTPGNVEVTASLGAPGDVPVVGDWDGNGTDTIGVFRPSNGGFYLRNSNTSGPGDIAFQFGGPGDIPISGNWGGNGADGVGVFRPSNGTFYIRSNDGSSYAVQFGSPGDTPVIGDWDHTGVEKIGVYRPSNSTFYLKYANSTVNSFSYGINGDIPVVGDWIGNGPDTIGVFRP